MKCPYCKCDDSWKMMKQRWMRYTPGDMKNMRCSSCGTEFTKWFGFIPLRHSTAKRMTLIWQSLLLILLFVSMGFLIPALISAIANP